MSHYHTFLPTMNYTHAQGNNKSTSKKQYTTQSQKHTK